MSNLLGFSEWELFLFEMPMFILSIHTKTKTKGEQFSHSFQLDFEI